MEKEQRSKAEFVKNGAPPVLGTGAKRKMGPRKACIMGPQKCTSRKASNGVPKTRKSRFGERRDNGAR